jgi:hypothetical protein
VEKFTHGFVGNREGKTPHRIPGCKWEDKEKRAPEEMICKKFDWINAGQDNN